MSRPALLDVNLLVALFNPAHVHHEAAHDWFSDHRADGWATCPITENGCVRVLAMAGAAAAHARPLTVVEGLRKFSASGHHQFWADAVSLRDEALFDLAAAGGHRQLTDVYLLGLAKKMGGRLATFDRTIPLTAVRGATREILIVIAPAEGAPE